MGCFSAKIRALEITSHYKCVVEALSYRLSRGGGVQALFSFAFFIVEGTLYSPINDLSAIHTALSSLSSVEQSVAEYKVPCEDGSDCHCSGTAEMSLPYGLTDEQVNELILFRTVP